MLLNIFIKDYGIIDQLDIEFQAGFNILTGETGAGKSIIIDALQVALGGRASVERIRSGSEKALLQIAFDTGGVPALMTLLEEQGLDIPEDAVLVMAREISHSGKNICRINGQVVTLSIYRKIGGNLADLHLQMEHNSTLAHERQRQLLDCYGGNQVISALETVNLLYSQWKETRVKYGSLILDAAERTRRVDTLRYQIADIEQACLRPGEDEELEAEKKVLVNAERISLLASQAHALLYDGRAEQASALDLLAQAVDSLKSLVSMDQRVEIMFVSLENAVYQLEDVAMGMALYRDGIENDPRRLEVIEQRLEQIRKQKRLYGETIPGVLKYLVTAKSELDRLENTEVALEDTNRLLEELEASYWRSCKVLSVARREAAAVLEKEVARELLSLEMGNVIFKIGFLNLESPALGGSEQVDFLISPNPGEPLKPLAKIASGGELTRIMLALKSLLAGMDEIPVLVFDEADTGIGGRALQAVAEKMSQLGRRHQVICVTHSAHVACRASAHHHVVKEFEGGRTVTKVELLDPRERLEELARMLGGKDVSDIARRHAGQMLDSAVLDKESEQ